MKEIKNITVNYDTNESKVITKGVAISFREKDDGDIEKGGDVYACKQQR